MTQKIRKAVIPAAGFGTRFLPQTKASPKEMLPIINKPVIQYVVEELAAAGIEEIIIVTGANKRSIEDHFDQPDLELVRALKSPKKKQYLDEVMRVPQLANFVYLRQKGHKGNGTPLINAASLIGDEPFIYSWADDLFLGEGNAIQQMVDAYEKYQAPIFACTAIETNSDFDRLGVVGGEKVEDGVIKMNRIIEKPGRDKAPSNLGSVHSYILTPDYLTELKEHYAAFDPSQGEFMIQPPVQSMIDRGEDFYALQIRDAKWCDTGTPEEYLKTINYAAQLQGLNLQ